MERLSRYLSATGRDVPKALELYEYNVQLSEVLYGIYQSSGHEIINFSMRLLCLSLWSVRDNPIYRSLYGSASHISCFRHLSEKPNGSRERKLLKV